MSRWVAMPMAAECGCHGDMLPWLRGCFCLFCMLPWYLVAKDVSMTTKCCLHSFCLLVILLAAVIHHCQGFNHSCQPVEPVARSRPEP